MSIVKLTKSGKALLFIDDDGNVFITSKTMLLSLIRDGIDSKFVLLNRLPSKCSDQRFKKSTVWDGNKVTQSEEYMKDNILKVSNDSLSAAVTKDKETTKAFIDKNVWGA